MATKTKEPKRSNGIAAFCRTQMGRRVVRTNKRSKLDRLRRDEDRRSPTGGYLEAGTAA